MEMSLTRVLNEIKLLDKKIQQASVQPFLMFSVGGKPATGYESIKDMENLTEANYNSVTDLISRRNKLKGLLTAANATTQVTIAGEKMTIAQAIDRKSSISLEVNLLNQMNAQLSNNVNIVENGNVQVQQNVDRLLEASFGRDKKITEAESEAITKPYESKHKIKLVDKINIRDKINKLSSKIEDFQNEVDFVLSEANAKTTIDVN